MSIHNSMSFVNVSIACVGAGITETQHTGCILGNFFTYQSVSIIKLHSFTIIFKCFYILEII